MGTFSILPHTADVGLALTGANLDDLFRTALNGMNAIMAPGIIAQAPSITKTIMVESADLTALLVDFMSEILTNMHIHKAVFTSVEFNAISPLACTAIIAGHGVTSFAEDIKAVTYHEAFVRSIDDHLEAMIIFDI